MNEIVVVDKSLLTTEGMIKTTDDGFIQSRVVKIPLSKRARHMWELSSGHYENNEWVTDNIDYFATADAYYFANKIAGLKVLKEETFNLNGQQYTNPHIVFNDGYKSQVYCKASVAGYGPDGSYQISTSFITYNCDDEFANLMMSKINKRQKKRNNARNQAELDKYPPIGKLCTKKKFEKLEEKHDNMYFINRGGGIGIAIDLNNSDIMQAFAAHDAKRTDMEKKAQTVAVRNAMRRHPAFSFYALDPKPVYKPVEVAGKMTDVLDDMVAYVEVVQWLKIDPEKEKSIIAEYLEKGDSDYATKAPSEFETYEADIEPSEPVEGQSDVIDLEPVEEADMTPYSTLR